MVRLFRVFVPASVLALLLSEITLIVGCFVAAAYVVSQVNPAVFLLYDGGAARIAVVALSIILGLYFHDLYSRILVKSRILLAQQLCQAVGIALLVQGILTYLSDDYIVSRRLMMVGSAMSLMLLFSWRVLYARYLFGVVGAQRVLLVGGSPVLGEIAGHVQEHSELSLRIVGVVDDCHLGTDPLRWGTKVVGPIAALGEIARHMRPDRIVVGFSDRRTRMPMNELLDLRFAGYAIEEAASAYEAVCGRIRTAELRPAQLIFSEVMGPRRGTLVIHIFLDYLMALAAAAVSLPIVVLVALAVKLSSPGPALYRQSRVGKDGVPFTLYKFRSMRTDAEKGTGAVWASRNDPRVTPIGRWLRKLRLDELPQLFNVLRGEMSIVGPRPERPEFVKMLSEQIPYYRQRHSVKPGITGWAQINHPYGDTLDDAVIKLEYDLYYMKNMSPSLDTYIIFHTLKTMLLSRGSR